MSPRYGAASKPPDEAPALTVPGPRPVVWAPQARTLEVVLPRGAGLTPDDPDGSGAGTERRPLRLVGMDLPGWWSADDDLEPGTDYGYSVDGQRALPDPRSPRQPYGVLGWSRSFDPAFAWTDEAWEGPPARGAVLEVDVAAFTAQGTLDAAVDRLDQLVDLGVALVELHTIGSVADVACPHLYTVREELGGPRALQRFVDAAHARGLGVSLGVAYHRAAPGASFLQSFAPYLAPLRARLRPPPTEHLADAPGPGDRAPTASSPTPNGLVQTAPVPSAPASGRRINLDRAGSREVHDWITSSARRWFDDFHVDALHVAQVQDLADASPVHVLAGVARVADAASLAHGRPVRLAGECDTSDPRLLVPAEQGGRGLSQVRVHDVEHALSDLLAAGREDDPAWFGTLSRLLTSPDAGRTQVALGPASTGRTEHADQPGQDDDSCAITAALVVASGFVPRLTLRAPERLRSWWQKLLAARRTVAEDTPRVLHRGPNGVLLVHQGRLVTAVNTARQPRSTLLPTSRRSWHPAAQWPAASTGTGHDGRPAASTSGSSLWLGARSAVVLVAR